MTDSRKVKDRWRKRKNSPETKKNAQIRREWRTGRRPAPQQCFNLYGNTTCQGCSIIDHCKLQEKELQKIRRTK